VLSRALLGRPVVESGPAVESNAMANTRMGRMMFFTCWSPMSSKPTSRLPCTCSRTAAEAHASSFGERLQARCYVDAIARNVVAVDDDVAQVDADTELDALVDRLRLIVRVHRSLHANRTTQRSVCATKFEQHSVTGSLDDPTSVFGNPGSKMRSRIARSRPNAAVSSCSIWRLKPTTSAMSMAASLRVMAL